MIDLQGKKGLIVGVANRDSIAWGCASAARTAGAQLALTYLNEKARPHVAPLAEELGAELLLPLDVEAPGQLEEAFAAVATRWGRLDFLVHSIAFAPAADLRGRVVDCSLAGFERAMRVSCFSLIEMARLAEPLMDGGGTIVTMSFGGADRVVPNYNLMGPVKAALQSTVRQLPVSPHVVKYATRLVRMTRPKAEDAPQFIKDNVHVGAGPRAAQFLVLGAKARAVLHGRLNVSCEDIKTLALPVMRHRIFTNFTADSEGIGPDDLVKQLLAAVPEPSEKEY